MISDELKEIIDQIKEQGRMSFLEAATEEQIEKFEKEMTPVLKNCMGALKVVTIFRWRRSLFTCWSPVVRRGA